MKQITISNDVHKFIRKTTGKFIEMGTKNKDGSWTIEVEDEVAQRLGANPNGALRKLFNMPRRTVMSEAFKNAKKGGR